MTAGAEQQAEGPETGARPRAGRIFASPYMLLAFAALCWSGNHVIGRAIGGHVPPIGISTVRWLIPSVVLWFLARRHLERDWPLIRSHWRIMLWLGVTGGALFSALQYVGLQYTTAVNVSVLNSLVPVLIVAAGGTLRWQDTRASDLCPAGAGISALLRIRLEDDYEGLGLATDAVASVRDRRIHVKTVAGLQYPGPLSGFELDATAQHEHELFAFMLEGNILADRRGESEYERLHVFVALGVSETFIVVSEGGSAANDRLAFVGTHHRHGFIFGRALTLEEIGDIDLKRPCNARQRRNRRYLSAVLDLREIARCEASERCELLEGDAPRSARLSHSVAEDFVNFHSVIGHRSSLRSPRSLTCSLARPFDTR
jgi:hypothetical protein